MAGRELSLFLSCWPLRWALSIAIAAGVVVFSACGPTFQQMAATECQGIASDVAYEECERRLSQQLADERLGYIVRSQVIGGSGGGGR